MDRTAVGMGARGGLPGGDGGGIMSLRATSPATVPDEVQEEQHKGNKNKVGQKRLEARSDTTHKEQSEARPIASGAAATARQSGVQRSRYHAAHTTNKTHTGATVAPPAPNLKKRPQRTLSRTRHARNANNDGRAHPPPALRPLISGSDCRIPRHDQPADPLGNRRRRRRRGGARVRQAGRRRRGRPPSGRP